jgi:peptide-methionine (R)-S-oxide reductase
MSDLKNKPEDYWRRVLTPAEFDILRKKGTEHPGTGKYLDNKEQGMYHCKACGTELFSSDTKFDHRGWPSFNDVVNNKNIELAEDKSHFMNRTEVKCVKCGSHLGHLFPDESQPTGKYYCINSACLNFKKRSSGGVKHNTREK